VVLSLPLRIVWLDRERDRALFTHVAFGDDLGIAGAGGRINWYRSAPIAARRDAHTLMLRYESDDEAYGLCVPASAHLAAAMERARKTARPAAAGRKWGPLLGKFSYLVDEAEPLFRPTPLAGKMFTHARRAAHPDPLIDRFLLRDRMIAEREFERRENSLDAGGERWL
jgi:hypothetical protein